MKMSKSIKDYKDAMDNIKISDSFYKRTEVMLSDLSDMELEKKPVFSGRRITAFVMTAAACLACVIGVKVMVDGRRNDMVSDETGITEILTSETIETFVTLPIVDDLDGGGDDDKLVDADDINALSEADSDNTSPTENDEKEQSRTEEEKRSAAEHEDSAITEYSETAPAADVPSGDKTGGLEAAATVMGADSGGNDEVEPPENESIVMDSDEILPEDDTDHDDDENTVPAENGAAAFPELRAAAVESITVEVTPYFNMGNVKSGEGAIKLNGADCADIISSIADISENSHEMGSYSFKSVFSVQIYNENYGETYYSIYITDLNAMIINTHSANGQSRETYGVQEDVYEALMHRLFLLFGSENDYELFGTLISGK